MFSQLFAQRTDAVPTCEHSVLAANAVDEPQQVPLRKKEWSMMKSLVTYQVWIQVNPFRFKLYRPVLFDKGHVQSVGLLFCGRPDNSKKVDILDILRV